jgi:AcrR family transcriptional regulator
MIAARPEGGRADGRPVSGVFHPGREQSLVYRDPRSLSSDERILLAGLRSFVQKGYHGTSIRSVARRAGVSVPGLYHHFESKSAILERLIDQVMDDLIAETEEALNAAGDDYLARLDGVVAAHVRFHCERIEESFIGNSELRSLSRSALKRIVGKRDHQQRIFDQVIEDGVEADLFHVQWPRESSRALVTMCTSVATWFRRDGPLSSDQVVEHYRILARNLVKSDPEPTSASSLGRRGRSRRLQGTTKPS